jgi:putative hydrolase of the HAD superfamily
MVDTMENVPLKAAVFDFGGVLTVPVSRAVMTWLAREGIEVNGYRTVMSQWVFDRSIGTSPSFRLETGELPGPEFERMLAAKLLMNDGSPVLAEGLLTRMFADMTVDDAMITLVRDLRAAGLRTGMLSNSWGNKYPEDLVAEIFDVSVISGEVGIAKPDPAIYHLLLERLAIPAESVAFVDDIGHNVEAAQGVGIVSVLHTDPAATRKWFAERVPQLEP